MAEFPGIDNVGLASTGVPRAQSTRTELLRRGFSQETAWLLPVLVPVGIAGAAVVVLAVWSFSASTSSLSTLAGVFALMAASTIAEAVPVPIESVAVGRTSLASIFIVGSAAIYDWAAGALVAFLAMALVEVGRRRPLRRVIYNTALYSLAAAAAGGAAALVEGSDTGALALRALLGSAAFYAVDITLLAAVVARSTRAAFVPFLGRYAYSTLLPLMIISSFAVILLVLWDRSPFIAVLLAGPLVAIALYQRWSHGALEQLRELDHLKDDFIAVVSHDLRTPLASVYGAAMTLQHRDLDEESKKSMLSIVYRESARLARLIDNILLASRLDSGSVETVIERCDSAELARGVVDGAAADLPPALTLELFAPPSPPAVAADSEKLKQVLVNLIENAVKYSPDGGTIEVRLERADGRVRFLVRDEGLGIPAQEQPRVFEKFHRLDPLLTRGVVGTGLGLYICHELVRQMNGRIWVTSEEGRGSTFSFELPLAADLMGIPAAR